jgi:hypothetical protein
MIHLQNGLPRERTHFNEDEDIDGTNEKITNNKTSTKVYTFSIILNICLLRYDVLRTLRFIFILQWSLKTLQMLT